MFPALLSRGCAMASAATNGFENGDEEGVSEREGEAIGEDIHYQPNEILC